MLIKRIWASSGRYLLAVLLVCLFANLVRILVVPKMNAYATNTSGYTVVLRETIANKDGRLRPGMVLTRAVRADGARVERLGDAQEGGRRIEYPSGLSITTSDKLKFKSTMKLDVTALTEVLDPGSNCTTRVGQAAQATAKNAPQFLGNETIGGVRTAKVKRNSTTYWYALDYACATVQTHMDFGNQGFSEMKLVALAPGEPDGSLFEIPSDFREGPPSEMMISPPNPNCGPDCQARQKVMTDKIDAVYYQRRP
jgi:hypothetical protein